ncbi:CIA30 family protein [Sphingomicrobium arenosum]|uniref:CIA30 family protein n=1 Tax=Sphingomicrobium arenosum TaxID=2233861 RepID=UPI00224102E2|nr:CIA30 family protein [Sphingomicrobium arenosum]
MEFVLAMSLAMSAGECRTIADFSDPVERARWEVVNDGVMGGLSRGRLSDGDGVMTFSGEIVTDGGGFSSIRRALSPSDLAGADRVVVQMRGDGRAYELTLRSDQRWRGRRVAWRGAIEAGEAVPFDALSPSLFGQALGGAAFDAASAHSIGIILADGRDGSFRLELEAILACRG